MELLFSWINYAHDGLFYHQGFNFSSEYDFVVHCVDDKRILSLNKEWKRSVSVFRSNTLENVTAVVGKNGSGKTSLLKNLSGLQCLVPHADNNMPGYESFYEEELKKSLCVYVFRDEDENAQEVIKIYHNLKDAFVNDTPFDFIMDMSDDAISGECLRNGSEIYSVLKLYVTNSGYTNLGGLSQNGKLRGVYLTPSGLSVISNRFYSKIFDLDNHGMGVLTEMTPYRRWRRILNSIRSLTDFQEICDVLYFNRLLKKGKFDSYSGKISTRLKVSISFMGAILDSKRDEITYKGELSAEETNRFFRDLMRESRNLVDNYEEPNIHIRNLIVNLVSEIYLAAQQELTEAIELQRYPKEINSWDAFLEWYAPIEENLNSKDEKFKEEHSYFADAVKEITEFMQILRKARDADNTLPSGDMAFDRSLIFDADIDREAYSMFLSFITKCVSSPHSFVLRYIKIGNLEMSSGERAFQNLFSWINLIPIFHQFDDSIPAELPHNILLLIDELDLYLHPEWQRIFVSLLIDEVESQFEGHKVQIIFATHSPLCLSDIPRENTVFLKAEGGKAFVDDRLSHKQTFGRDIYTLFNDAFYLDDVTMGEYAKSYVDGIIKRIIDSETSHYKKIGVEERAELEENIERIGNPALKTKLFSMLCHTFRERDEEVRYLKRQVAQISERIARMEEGYDSD